MESEPRISIDAILMALEPKVSKALEEIGERELAAIYKALSVPVKRDFAGNVIERSKPGDAPRMDEGILREGGSLTIRRKGRKFILMIGFSRSAESAGDDPNAAIVLETQMYRPFMKPALERMKTYVVDVLKKHLGASGSGAARSSAGVPA